MALSEIIMSAMELNDKVLEKPKRRNKRATYL